MYEKSDEKSSSDAACTLKKTCNNAFTYPDGGEEAYLQYWCADGSFDANDLGTPDEYPIIVTTDKKFTEWKPTCVSDSDCAGSKYCGEGYFEDTIGAKSVFKGCEEFCGMAFTRSFNDDNDISVTEYV